MNSAGLEVSFRKKRGYSEKDEAPSFFHSSSFCQAKITHDCEVILVCPLTFTLLTVPSTSISWVSKVQFGFATYIRHIKCAWPILRSKMLSYISLSTVKTLQASVLNMTVCRYRDDNLQPLVMLDGDNGGIVRNFSKTQVGKVVLCISTPTITWGGSFFNTLFL